MTSLALGRMHSKPLKNSKFPPRYWSASNRIRVKRSNDLPIDLLLQILSVRTIQERNKNEKETFFQISPKYCHIVAIW